MAAKINAQYFDTQASDFQASSDLQHGLTVTSLNQGTEQSRQIHNVSGLKSQQARTHRVQSMTGGNSSAMQRYSNLQNFNIKQRQGNPAESGEAQNLQNDPRHSLHQQTAHTSFQARNNQTRTDSNGPNHGVKSNGGQLSSGKSYHFAPAGMMRSRTTGMIGMRSGIGSLNCPCHSLSTLQAQNKQKFARHPSQLVSIMKADMGHKQPMLASSEATANCGHCGQFYAVKVGPVF